MPDYPFKVRVRVLRNGVQIIKMVPSAGGSYYAQKRLTFDHMGLFEAIEAAGDLQALDLPSQPPRDA